MKFNYIFSVLLFVLVSCSKNNGPSAPSGPPNPPDPGPDPIVLSDQRLKWEIVDNDTTTYLYGPGGLIKMVQFPTYHRLEYLTYPNKVVQVLHNLPGTPSDTLIHILRADGLIDTALTSVGSQFEIYLYDANKKLARTKTTTVSTGLVTQEAFYTFVNGNLMKDSVAQHGAFSFKREYEYYTDKLSTTEGNPNAGFLFAGTGNKNCVKKKTTSVSGQPTKVSTYTYQFEANGRVKSCVESYDTGGNSVTRFVYY